MSLLPRSPLKVPLPHEAEAEEAVVACLMLDPVTVDEVATLHESDIYQQPVRIVYRVVRDLIRETGTCDEVTLLARLRAMGALEEVGGMRRVADMLSACPTASNVRHWVRLVQQAADRRKLVLAALDALHAHESGALNDRAVETLKARVVEIGEREAPGDAGREMAEVIREWEDQERAGVQPVTWTTSLVSLHQYLEAIQPGDLGIVAGRPGHGKSTLMRRMAFDLAHIGPVIYWSVEEPDARLAKAMAATIADVPKGALRHARGNLTQAQREGVTYARERLRELPIRFLRQSKRRLEQVVTLCRRTKRAGGLTCFVLDYIQNAVTGDGTQTRDREISEWSAGLKRLAMELDIAVIVGAQINRSGQASAMAERRPRLSQLRECGALEADCDWALGVFNPYVEAKKQWQRGIMEVDTMKNRDGDLGIAILGLDGAMAMEVTPARKAAYEAEGVYYGGLVRP